MEVSVWGKKTRTCIPFPAAARGLIERGVHIAAVVIAPGKRCDGRRPNMDPTRTPSSAPTDSPRQPNLPEGCSRFQYCRGSLSRVGEGVGRLADTVEGRGVHRRNRSRVRALPEPEQIAEEDRIHARSVTLSERSASCKVDMIDGRGRAPPSGVFSAGRYKRGRRPA